MNPAAALPQSSCCSRPCRAAATAWPSQLNARRALRGAAVQRDCSLSLRHGALPSPRCFQTSGGVSPHAQSARDSSETEAGKHTEAGVSGAAGDENGSHASPSADPRHTARWRQNSGGPDRPQAGLRDAFSQRIPPLPARAALATSSANHAAVGLTASPSASADDTPRAADAGSPAASGAFSSNSTDAAPAPLAVAGQAAILADGRGGDAGGSGSGSGSFSAQVGPECTSRMFHHLECLISWLHSELYCDPFCRSGADQIDEKPQDRPCRRHVGDGKGRREKPGGRQAGAWRAPCCTSVL